VASVKRYSEENVRGLRTAVGDKRVVGGSLKVGVFKVNVGEAMTSRREVDEPAAFAQKRRNPVDQHKVAEMISAKLRLKTIRRVAEGCGHHACIGDNHVEELPLRQQFIRTFTHAFEASEIERDEFETSAGSRSIFADLCGRRFSFFQIARGTDDLCPVSCQRSRRLNT